MSEFKYPYGRRKTDSILNDPNIEFENPFPDADWKAEPFDTTEYRSTAAHVTIGIICIVTIFFAIIGFADTIKFIS